LKFESAIDNLFRSTDCSALKFERAVRTQVRLWYDRIVDDEEEEKEKVKEKCGSGE
jgi:hypothetical protein